MLTDSQIKAAKPSEKAYRLADANSLRLNITPAGGKHWQLKYRLNNREYTASLGSYPQVGLAKARKLADDARELVRQDIHPLAAKKAQKAAKQAEQLNSFGSVVEAWIGVKKKHWAPYTFKQVRFAMDRYILGNKELADKPIREVRSKDLRSVLQSIAERTELKAGERKKSGAVSVARNVRVWCHGVFVFAIEHDYADTDPTAAIRNLTELKKPAGSIKHNKKLTPAELKKVLAAMDSFSGTRQTAIAMALLQLFFVRTKELIEASWQEFDFAEKQWRIPATRMKAKKPHMVPISTQALALLQEQQLTSGKNGLVLPNRREPKRPMSNTTINRALERMGLNGPGTMGLSAHGFRGTASTLLHEMEFPTEVIEIQLAHTQRDAVKASYNEAQYVDKRTKMMQFWADYLDKVRTSKEENPPVSIPA
ncbi:MAG: integrase [Burkholderiales bacterium PBB1]|nr:MAG: integrase [Burkholderiales bacterium PBB1]